MFSNLLAPENSDVHIWHGFIDNAAVKYRSDYDILDEREQSRARALGSSARGRYIFARATLRKILGRYLRINPRRIIFSYSKKGKPFLITSPNATALHFNVSHSGCAVVYAFSRRRLGIDIELIDKQTPWILARHFLSKKEFNELKNTGRESAARGFFYAWARKESYIKAHAGERTSHQIEISVSASVRPVLIHDAQDPLAVLKWKIYDLYLFDRYAAALTVEGTQHAITAIEIFSERHLRL